MTLYFQLQFMQVSALPVPRVPCLLKKERMPAKRETALNLQERKCHENPEKK